MKTFQELQETRQNIANTQRVEEIRAFYAVLFDVSGFAFGTENSFTALYDNIQAAKFILSRDGEKAAHTLPRKIFNYLDFKLSTLAEVTEKEYILKGELGVYDITVETKKTADALLKRLKPILAYNDSDLLDFFCAVTFGDEHEREQRTKIIELAKGWE